MLTGGVRAGCRATTTFKSRIYLIHLRKASQNGLSIINSSITQNIDDQSKHLWSDRLDKRVKEIDNFIRSYSSSIGIDGVLLLTNIQHNIIHEFMYEQMMIQSKHKNEQMMIQFKHKNEQMMIQFKHKNEIDYIKWSFAEVSQRFLLELFFQQVINELSIRDSVDGTSYMMKYFPTCFNSAGKKSANPSKSSVENLLRRDRSVWLYVKSTMGIQCEFPQKLKNVLLYGELSEKIHLPRLYRLYLPSDMEVDIREFFIELSRILNYQAEEIDVHSAAAFTYKQTNTNK